MFMNRLLLLGTLLLALTSTQGHASDCQTSDPTPLEIYRNTSKDGLLNGIMEY